MGEVWEALDTRYDRRVALKLLPPGALSNPELKERFQRECRLAMIADHPHVLTVYDYDAGERPFIAMRLIDGTDLASEIRKGPLEPERAVHIVEQVAAALDAAHELKLRHRDVKPSNIMLEPGATQGTDHASLFDWGIAQLIDISEAPGVTRAGQLVGTPGYIAPERLERTDSDHRADVYSLAVVLYECLAGRRPFEGRDWEVLSAHVRDDPPQLPSYLPAGLRAVAVKGLAKRPEERYQRASELAAAARAALSESVEPPTRVDGPPPDPTPPDPPPPGPRATPVGSPQRDQAPRQVRSPQPERRPPEQAERPVEPMMPPRRDGVSSAVWTVVGAVSGLVVAVGMGWTGLIDESMSTWVVPVLVVAGALLAWGLRPCRAGGGRGEGGE